MPSYSCFVFEPVGLDYSNFFTLSSSSDVLIHSTAKYFNIIFISNIAVWFLLNNCISLLKILFHVIHSLSYFIQLFFVSLTIFITTSLSSLSGILSNSLPLDAIATILILFEEVVLFWFFVFLRILHWDLCY